MNQTMPSHREMERALFARDATYDGVFVAAVKTTGIFCRPSCPARKPFPENIEYYATPRDAIFAGYRACRRCHPMEVNGAAPSWVAGLVAHVEADPGVRIRDQDIRERGLDPARVRRYFLARYGMTFHAYCRGRRMAAALEDIRRGGEIDDVVFDHGYESHSGFREAFAKAFGTSPGRATGDEAIAASLLATPLGPMIVGATPRALCLAEFTTRRMLARQMKILTQRFRCAIVPGVNDVLDQAKREFLEYFAGTRRRFDVAVEAPGTPFQELVWRAVAAIPYGETRAYESIAREVGRNAAVRAVGTANGMNRIAIAIPCHRVVNKNGALGGYGGGKWRKLALLDLERGPAA
ncbi:MAG TPA: methylated-DNA--[protein]-cysteine S-methyltransferase [Candidatus Krumholzibacteria bacterium]|nr:methylated-DNA--[protein]-cysteine S-methyltransferase [Candidatus Krumholzibacteria bacterium]